MILEHGVYTAALAIIVAMIYEMYTKKTNSYLIAAIVWVAMIIPDTDYLVAMVTKYGFHTNIIVHGTFHNIVALMIFAVVGGIWVTNRYKTQITLDLAMICIAIGYVSHFLEDALVYEQAYPFLAPFSMKVWETGWLVPARDVFVGGLYIGSSNVFTLGFVLLAGAVFVRCCLMGEGWLGEYGAAIRDKIARSRRSGSKMVTAVAAVGELEQE